VAELNHTEPSFVDSEGRKYYVKSYDERRNLYTIEYLLPRVPDSATKYDEKTAGHPVPNTDLFLVDPAEAEPRDVFKASVRTQFHIPRRRVGVITAACSVA
jgi:hypothetical protein